MQDSDPRGSGPEFGDPPMESIAMNDLIYRNLDTSFVNITALVRHLCGRGFTGKVSVETDGYRAELELNGTDEIEVREWDLVTGRNSEGEEAMQRLLVRARSGGYSVDVTPTGAATESSSVMRLAALQPEPQIPIVQARASAVVENLPAVDIPLTPLTESEIETAVEVRPVFSELVGHPVITESQTVSSERPDADWQELLGLTAELLTAVDRSLAVCGLDFQAAFAKASSELANDYLFLRSVVYSAGVLHVGERPEPALFVSGVMDVMRRVMHRLGANPQFVELHRSTAERLVGLVHRNKERYDRYHVTVPLYRVLGVHV